MQAAAASMHVPWQSFLFAGQVPAQARFTHVAVPPTGSAQRVQDRPHDFGSSELTQAPAHACSSALQVSPDGPSSPATSDDDGESTGESTGASTAPSVVLSFLASWPPSPT